MMNEVATYKALQHLQGDVIPRLEEHGYTVSLGGLGAELSSAGRAGCQLSWWSWVSAELVEQRGLAVLGAAAA